MKLKHDTMYTYREDALCVCVCVIQEGSDYTQQWKEAEYIYSSFTVLNSTVCLNKSQ